MKITCHGAAQTVTGSRHLIELENGKRLLLDCGLFQGHDIEEIDHLNRHFGFDPSTIDYVILSHAHMDHSGNLPRLVKEGFEGTIFCTPPTFKLCEVMLADSAFIQKVDIRHLNKIRKDRGHKELKPLYHKGDLQETIDLFQTVDYEEPFQIDEHFSFCFYEAGHILGSAMIELIITENGKTTSICFTGDLGRPKNRLLNPPQRIPDTDYLLCESTYGNRLHEPLENSHKELFDQVIHTCQKKGGKLLIPAFSLGRTQEVVLELERLFRDGDLPPLDVFVDSPLALKATDITFKHKEYCNQEFQDYISGYDDPLGMKGVHYVASKEESKAINFYHGPCIIISASGMLEGGRILHHAKNLVSEKENTFLFVGFSTPESLGGKLLAGEEEVEILNNTYQVRAEVTKTDIFSAHADYEEMLSYLRVLDKERLKKVLLVHGEGESQRYFAEKLESEEIGEVHIAGKGQTFQLDS